MYHGGPEALPDSHQRRLPAGGSEAAAGAGEASGPGQTGEASVWILHGCSRS